MKKLLLFITLLLSFTANSQIKLWQLPYLSSPATSDTLIIRRGINYKTAVSNVLSLAGGGGGLDTTAADARYIKNQNAVYQTGRIKVQGDGYATPVALFKDNNIFGTELELIGSAGEPMIFQASSGGGLVSGGTQYEAHIVTTNNFNLGFLNGMGLNLRYGYCLFSGGPLGIGSGVPDASAKLDVVSTTQGLLPPRMTTSQKNAITSPAEGLTVYDLTLHKLYVYDGTTWQAAW